VQWHDGDISYAGKARRTDALLAQTSTSKQDAALFSEMLSLPNDGRYPAPNMDPQQRRQKTLEALTTHVKAFSHQNPLLMVFEDAHWSDPTSLEALGRVVDRVRSLTVLMIVTFRPEFDPPWIGRAARQRGDDRRCRRQQVHTGECPARNSRTHGRHPPVRRGNDQVSFGSRE
jgi:hypothetical protein